jgi:hypothetical protein
MCCRTSMEVVATRIQDDAPRSLGYRTCIKQDHGIVYAAIERPFAVQYTKATVILLLCYAVNLEQPRESRRNYKMSTSNRLPAWASTLPLTLAVPSSLLAYNIPMLWFPMYPLLFEYLETDASRTKPKAHAQFQQDLV